MAFIPDLAILDSAAVSRDAFRLYTVLCLRRNRKSDLSFASISGLQAILRVSRAQVYKALSELKKADWVAGEPPKLICLYGDFSPASGPFVLKSPAVENLSPNGDKKSPAGDSPLKEYTSDLNQVFNTSYSDFIPISSAKQNGRNGAKQSYRCRLCYDHGLIQRDPPIYCECEAGQRRIEIVIGSRRKL